MFQQAPLNKEKCNRVFHDKTRLGCMQKSCWIRELWYCEWLSICTVLWNILTIFPSSPESLKTSFPLLECLSISSELLPYYHCINYPFLRKYRLYGQHVLFLQPLIFILLVVRHERRVSIRDTDAQRSRESDITSTSAVWSERDSWAVLISPTRINPHFIRSYVFSGHHSPRIPEDYSQR